MQFAPVGLHPMQCKDGDRPRVAPAATDVAVRLVARASGLGAGSARLQSRALAGREKDDLAAGEISGIEVVVLAARELPDIGPVDVHLEDVIERILGQIVLVSLVDQVGHMGIILAVSEQHTSAVVRQIGTQKRAVVPIVGQRSHLGPVGLESLQ